MTRSALLMAHYKTMAIGTRFLKRALKNAVTARETALLVM